MRSTWLFLLLAIAGVAHGQTDGAAISLWPKGAPGFENLRNEPEQAKDWWVKHVNNPTITAYLPPKEIATGASVVIAPGGGHSVLVFGPEGTDPARYLNKLGIAAFVLKYRLGREDGSPYKIEVHAKEDAYRAMRYVRSHAAEWNLDPHRVGFLGFSAGGEVAAFVTYGSGDGDPSAPDPIDRLNGRPDFSMIVYPGGLGFPSTVDPSTPPTFFVVSNDDDGHSNVVVDMLPRYRAAKVPVEVHIYAKGGHGYNMGYRSDLASIRAWPQRMADWLADGGFLKPLKNK